MRCVVGTVGAVIFFGYADLEARVAKKHPLRLIRVIVNDVVENLPAEFGSVYSDMGRPSIAPEKLLRQLNAPTISQTQDMNQNDRKMA